MNRLIGKPVWYWATAGQDQPFAGIIVRELGNDRVSLIAFSEGSTPLRVANVPLMAKDALKRPFPHCEYPPDGSPLRRTN